MKILIIDKNPSLKYAILRNIKGIKIDLVRSIADAVWYLWDEYKMIILDGALKNSLSFVRMISLTHNKDAKIIIYCKDDGQEFYKILPNATIRQTHANH